jgi:DNA-binding transcriptional MerR regulator
LSEDELTPTEASKRLGIPTWKLRRYVANFTHLFSESARQDRERRYTSADLDILQRIQALGERVSFVPLSRSARLPTKASKAELLAREGPATLESLAMQLRALQDQILALIGVSQIEWSVLTQQQESLQKRLDLIASRVQAKFPPTVEYIRTAASPTWHWITSCPHYPRGGRFITRGSLPPNPKVCPVCLRIEMMT